MIVVLGAIGTLLACAIIEAAIRSLPPSYSLADGMPTTEDKLSLLASAACGRSAALFSKVCLRRCFVFMRCHLVRIDAHHQIGDVIVDVNKCPVP